MSMNTPAFTMVDECRSALVGVGATIAPNSQVWNGICAALVMPARLKHVSGNTTSAGANVPMTMKSRKSTVLNSSTMKKSAARNAMPPTMFMTI